MKKATFEPFEVRELWILGNSEKIGGAWVYPCAWRFPCQSDKDRAGRDSCNYGYIETLPGFVSHGGAVIRGRVVLHGARRVRGCRMVLERCEIVVEGWEG